MNDLATWLKDQIDDAETSTRTQLYWAQQTILTLQDPKLLGRHIPGWHDWPAVEKLCQQRLIELDVQRRILDRHVLKPGERQRICAECGGRDWKPDGRVLHPFPWVMPWPCPTLRLLALPYADNPGYRDEWRPR